MVTMGFRRYISSLLLVVYLLATGGTAYRSLSCRCLDAVHVAEHLCCGAHAVEAAETVGAAEALHATCPCDRHSTAVKLYTGIHNDDDKTTRCAVTFLPPSLAVECPCPAHVPALRRNAPAQPVPLIAAPFLAVGGLRAPPVSA